MEKKSDGGARGKGRGGRERERRNNFNDQKGFFIIIQKPKQLRKIRKKKRHN